MKYDEACEWLLKNENIEVNTIGKEIGVSGEGTLLVIGLENDTTLLVWITKEVDRELALLFGVIMQEYVHEYNVKNLKAVIEVMEELGQLDKGLSESMELL